MSNPRLFPDTFYANGVPLPASLLQGLDAAQTAGLDGDAGNGTWNPTSAIDIGGAGMWAGGPWTLSPPSAGTVQVVLSGGSVQLTHGDNDYVTIASGHSVASRDLVTQVALGKDSSGCPTYQTPLLGQGIIGPTALMLPDVFDQSMSNTYRTGYPYRPGGRFVVPLRVHDGATLLSVTFNFLISTHSALPQNFPQFRVHKVDIAGNLTSLYSGTPNGSGFLELPSPGSVAAYNATAQFTYNLDAGVVIDASKYSYFVEVVDESGTNAQAQNVFLSAVGLFSEIPDMRPQ